MPSRLLWFCRELPSVELSIGRLVTGVRFCCYVGCLLLGGTQADDSDVLGLRVLTLHLCNYAN